MPLINFIAPQAIDDWLHDRARARDQGRAEATAQLLSIALKSALLHHESAAEKLVVLPPDAPAWAQNKWDVMGKSPLYRFAPENDPDLQGKVDHVVDWLVAAQVHDAPFLKERDGKGQPRLLAHIKSVDEAVQEADKYNAVRHRASTPFLLASAAQAGVRPFFDCGDGMSVVELCSPEALKREGAIMQHCIGNGAYDSAVETGCVKILSLRDRRGNPHVTFEIFERHNVLRQCKGKQNKAPAERYLPFVQALVRHQKYHLEERNVNTGLVQARDGVYHCIDAMPEGLRVRGSLDLRESGVSCLPKGLQVEKNLWLQKTHVTSLPEGLRVKGILSISQTDVSTLPDDIEVGIILMPDGLSFKGTALDQARAWFHKRSAEEKNYFPLRRLAVR